MKKLTLIAIVLTSGLLNAQDLVPDFKNQPTALVGGKMVKLEKVSAEVKQKVNGMGYGGVSQNIQVDGPASPVILSSNPEFLLKVDADTDPETVFYLAICLKAKKVRSIEVAKTSAFAAYGATGKSAKRFHVALTYEKISDGLYKVKVGETLKVGEEYAFVMKSSGATGQMSNVFCFGVK
jgi:hypothetical protein